MANVQENIARLFPEATFEEGEWLLVNIPDAKWHSLAKTLKEDPEFGFDYLVAIVGMDWTETLGCMYYLTSTTHNTHVSVKVTTSDRENPMLHSISDLWAVANLYEREVYDYYGIIFINHPDMRRLFLRNDWVGYPLRKDYNDDPNVNPVRLDHEAVDDVTVSYVEDADGNIEKKEVTIFRPEDFVVNIGPQHPATHGVLRFRTAVEGETITKIDLYLGYIHRGIEKLCEGLGYPQTLHFTDRLDYLSAQQNRHCLCLCIEKALGIEVPRRAQVIRVMMDELMRISSHLLFMGTFCMDLGATTMLFYTLRERETILNIFEKTCGARMTFNYNCIGGIMDDIDADFVKDVKHLIEIMPAAIKEYNTIFTGNVIANNRMVGVGHLSKEDAISYGATGPVGRASGWACDVRKTAPYSIYSELDFDEVVLHEGDCMARFVERIEEIKQSLRILEQLVDNIPDGEICAKVPKVIKLPEGHWFQQVEASRGAFGVYIESHGANTPWRVKFNSPCMNLAGVVDHLTRGSKIADLITIGGTLDYVVPDIDR
ncbi:NADH-quinone oxidoreductase subunit D [Barnesiella sp. WM24]|uniref:NADH-quinone oxidoreductase subunit D-related protein n=1 Tax=Barnesiella sp. WM24 TaxID=2558278 RepID=UPI00107227F3|nr:NADH-quinone oxidoreductase subunit C [Barnesiella sp. WM24]MDE6115326.1 NADH-quinone oxidoreductase subunit D [Muribaculum sp.]TFU94861.1 NADH-quinone oxidoreductase subunit D [Barnesiella sp. WM24]